MYNRTMISAKFSRLIQHGLISEEQLSGMIRISADTGEYLEEHLDDLPHVRSAGFYSEEALCFHA